MTEIPLHAGVYRLPGSPVTWHQRLQDSWLTAPVRPETASGAASDGGPDAVPDAVPETVLDGVGAAIMVPPYRRGHGRGAPGTAPGRE